MWEFKENNEIGYSGISHEIKRCGGGKMEKMQKNSGSS